MVTEEELRALLKDVCPESFPLGDRFWPGDQIARGKDIIRELRALPEGQQEVAIQLLRDTVELRASLLEERELHRYRAQAVLQKLSPKAFPFPIYRE